MTLQTRVPVGGCGQEGARVGTQQGEFPWAQAPGRPQGRHSCALAAGPCVRSGPAAAPVLVPLLHDVRQWERTPRPTLPVTRWCHWVPSVLQRHYFSSTTKATFKSRHDIFTGTGHGDGSILFREAQSRRTRGSGEQAGFCLKDVATEDSGEHLVCFASPLLSRGIQRAHPAY